MPLSESDKERYRRQILVEGWDQEKVSSSRVAIVGAGGLGGVSATYLAAAGVGRLKICDSDKVELSNLNRQILFSNEDIGKPKADLAVRKLSALNPSIRIESACVRMDETNASELLSGCDLIIDGLDNHESRMALNRISCRLKIPFIYGAVNDWQGQLAFFNPPETPCLACLLSEHLIGPSPVPVFGALPGAIGAMQAVLALRYLITGSTPLLNKLLLYHADTMQFETVAFEKRIGCSVCDRK